LFSKVQTNLQENTAIMPTPQIIAIDGPAASGKSTIAEKLAHELGYLFFDTGLMYRAVTYAALKHLQSVDNETAVSALAYQVEIDVRASSVADGRMCDVILDGEDVSWTIRRPEVEANVSQVSAYPEVRKAMTAQQRKIGQRGKVVMVGRDIGTVVLPEAELKIYLDASVEERARRRYDEVTRRGTTADYEDILLSMRKRDKIDSTRAVAPLKPAEDAVRVNTDGLDIHQVFDKVLGLVNSDC
jgi:CMP/dCMP kinase